MGVTAAARHVALALEVKVQSGLPSVLGGRNVLSSCGCCVNGGAEVEFRLHLEPLRRTWVDLHFFLVIWGELWYLIMGLGWGGG